MGELRDEPQDLGLHAGPDGRPRTRIAADIPDVAAAKTNFDGITYAKGASVLKQLVAWVGEDAFYEGARRLLCRAPVRRDEPCQDLLVALEGASRQELSSWKSAWLETSGPSTLSASWVTDAVGAITDFTLHQGWRGLQRCAASTPRDRVDVARCGWRTRAHARFRRSYRRRERWDRS